MDQREAARREVGAAANAIAAVRELLDPPQVLRDNAHHKVEIRGGNRVAFAHTNRPWREPGG